MIRAVRFGGVLALLVLGSGCGEPRAAGSPPRSSFSWISPAARRLGSRETPETNPPRTVELHGFWIGRREITTSEYAAYLTASGLVPAPEIPDLVRRGKPWRARFGRGGTPVRNLTREEAAAYCEWAGSRHGLAGRLPAPDEWEAAARGGIEGARYPWGWGEPRRQACYAARGPVRAGRYAPNGYGLRDMAGNVFEWCAPAEPGAETACGGAWSEPDPRRLRVFERTEFPPGYRGLDVGFRVLLEEALAKPPSSALQAKGPEAGSQDSE
jgi:formylglycine-generating enzyme required for sulfatase activity